MRDLSMVSGLYNEITNTKSYFAITQYTLGMRAIESSRGKRKFGDRLAIYLPYNSGIFLIISLSVRVLTTLPGSHFILRSFELIEYFYSR